MLTRILESESTRWVSHLIGVLLCGITLVVYQFVFCGNWNKGIEQGRERAEELTQEFERGKQLRKKLKVLTSDLAEVNAIAEQLPSTFPDDQNQTESLLAISKRLDKTDLKISEFRKLAVKDLPNCKKLTVNIQGQGDFAELCRLTAELENAPRLIRIEKFALQASGLNRQNTFSIVVAVFFDFVDSDTQVANSTGRSASNRPTSIASRGQL